MSLVAGIASARITPPLGESMGGYISRDHGCTGVLEDLFLQSLYLEDENHHALVIVGADIVFFPKEVTDAVCRRLRQELPSRGLTILLNASHTHCGPHTVPQLLDSPSPECGSYLNFLKETVISTTRKAFEARKPMWLKWRTAEARLSMNRRLIRNGTCHFAPDPKGAIDPQVTVWSLHGDAGQTPSMVWFSYSCHPNTHAGYLISPDWPGIARKIIVEKLGSHATAIFTQGTCGEIRPPWTPGQPGTPEQAKQMGGQLADVVLNSLATGQDIHTPVFRSASATIPLPFSSCPTEEDLNIFEGDSVDPEWCRQHLPTCVPLVSSQEEMTRNRRIRRLWTARMRERRACGDLGKPLGLGTTLVELAPDFRILAMEGEICFDLARQIRRQTAQPNLQIMGYTNDGPGYIPSERILREGGYEGSDSQIYFGQPSAFAEGVERRLVEGVNQLVHRITRSNPRRAPVL